MSDDRDTAIELNLDGIVGPTHSYAGLSYGNLASQRNRQAVSNPREAALQGLAKMKVLAGLGVPQAVLPPQERPDVDALRRLGFGGASDADVLARAACEAPALLAACCSASGMWAANAATVSAGADTADGRVHFTPANLITQFHRSLEPPTTARALRAIFADEACFAHHPPLPSSDVFADEGAANHMRLGPGYGRPGVEVFVYGRSALNPAAAGAGPRRFPARQTREASTAIARLHGLDAARTVFVQQCPTAIDGGAFHNDVVAVGNLDVLLIHETAFAAGPSAVDEIRRAYASACNDGVGNRAELTVITVGEQDVSLEDAVSSYLFNSQLVRLPDGSTSLVAPVECRDHSRVRPVIDRIVGPGRAIASVHFVDVRQSMRNGGGPACLRLRVPLTAAQLGRVHAGVMFNDALHASLTQWVQTHYRDELRPEDLADPRLLVECRDALDALTRLLGIGSIYRFQGASTASS